jgi:hypothetical protein
MSDSCLSRAALGQDRVDGTEGEEAGRLPRAFETTKGKVDAYWMLPDSAAITLKSSKI